MSKLLPVYGTKANFNGFSNFIHNLFFFSGNDIFFFNI